MRETIVVVMAILFLTTPAKAYYLTEPEDCTTVDLRADAPSMPMRDQGDISWCYAHSASDYLQYYFKLPTPISAADVALLFNQRAWPRLLRWIRGANVGETGFARSAMWDVLSAGYCPEEYLPSNRWTKRYVTGEKAGHAEPMKINAAFEDLLNLKDQIRMGLYKSAAEVPYLYEFKDISHEQLYAILSQATDRSLPNDLRIAACDGHRVPFPGDIGAIGMRAKGRNTFTRINAVLDTRTPVDVDFFSGFLENDDHYSRSLSELHSTLLVGRKYDAQEGECRYLIRNSYGTGCEGYDPYHQCDNGYVWVTESSLYRAMVSYVYVKDVLVDDTGPDLESGPVPPQSQSD